METSALRRELATLLNKHGRENKSDTPDYLLSEYLLASLNAFEVATRKRDTWHQLSPWPKAQSGIQESNLGFDAQDAS